MMWSTPLDKFTDLVVDDVNETVKNAATDMVNGLTNKTPIDTTRAVSNWNVSLDNYDWSYDENKQIGRGAARAQGIRVLNSIRGRELHNVYICNATPYIVYLNAGYSAQSPNGIVYPVFSAVTMWYR